MTRKPAFRTVVTRLGFAAIVCGSAVAGAGSPNPNPTPRLLPPPVTFRGPSAQEHAGEEAFRCAPASPAPSSSALSPIVAVPKAAAKAGKAPGWVRLTAPTTLGAPSLHELAMTSRALLGAGEGIRRSIDGGRTWTDVSSAIELQASGWHEDIRDLVRVGGNVLAVSSRKLYLSTDDGAHFAACEVSGPTLPARNLGPLRLAVDGARVHLAWDLSHWVSDDEGLSWRFAPGTLANSPLDGFAAGKYGLWLPSTGPFGMYFQSPDDGRSWRLLNFLPLMKDDTDRPSAFAESAGQLYVGTTLGKILVSKDGGRSFAIRSPGAVPMPNVDRLVPVTGAVLAMAGSGLLRSTDKGPVTRVISERPLAVTATGAEVFALTASRLFHSIDAGQSFTQSSPVGLGSDAVRSMSAFGRAIGITESGGRTHFSLDAGTTWFEGPDAPYVAEVLASSAGVLFSISGERSGLYEVTDATLPPRRLPTPTDWGTGPTNASLVARDGRTLMVYPWQKGKLTVSHDGGETWSEIVDPSFRYEQGGRGVLYPDELLLTSGWNLWRSLAGGPLARVRKPLPKLANAQGIVAADGAVYLINSGRKVLSSKDRGQTFRDLKLPLAVDNQEYVRAVAARRGQVLALVQAKATQRLALFNGSSWTAVPNPTPLRSIEAIAAFEAGFLAAGEGVWLLPPAG